ncbi:Domain of unknown function DUF1801 [Kribbella flavida DSM 17836]|uniref:YdhG-like domain-containing protein n=1 Tax=Kribbella flavida (strain DSM 17836 / JCM 10339 / NBRC 14399) TaxID=479435 RepID=D2PZ79_KRIFD|nr:DUF1801 domain-containing protein [Kribbella flavida]ADB33688.1 Domain of unknown function DUF1801 [Kribbella flavida DSM 17836]
MAESEFANVDDYLATQPAEVREVLENVRQVLHDAVPGAGETISYNMPTLTLDDKPLLYFSGWKQHISLYPIPPVDEDLAAAITPYIAGKGTLKFPLQEPIPYDLVARIAGAFVAGRGK